MMARQNLTSVAVGICLTLIACDSSGGRKVMDRTTELLDKIDGLIATAPFSSAAVTRVIGAALQPEDATATNTR
jgi:hypothetical protein